MFFISLVLLNLHLLIGRLAKPIKGGEIIKVDEKER